MKSADDGFSHALELFRLMSRRVPAYKDFLKKHNIQAERIKTRKDFEEVPLMDKKNYLKHYPLRELCFDGKIPPMAYASSGSSGKPTFWVTGDEQESVGAAVHETIFRDIFGIKKDEPTLVVICFSMGIWVAGTYTLAACRAVSRKGYQITSVTPGIEKETIMTILRDLAPQFKHVILVGYPSFIMDIVVDAAKMKVLPKDTKIMTAGDRTSEEWRSSVLHLLGDKASPTSIINMYGCADAAVLGYETPLSVFIRRSAIHDAKLRHAFFEEQTELPTLVNYDPSMVYFEAFNKNLIFTTAAGIPLVRYNIRDTGKILNYEEASKILKECDKDKEVQKHGLGKTKLPFIVQTGRTDVAVTFYALNIFPENVRAGLEDKQVKDLVSGQFLAFTKIAKVGNEENLHINVELASGIKPKAAIMKFVRNAVWQNLRALNVEYRKLYATFGDRALPNITLFSFGDKSFHSPHVHGVLYVKGKKPRMVL